MFTAELVRRLSIDSAVQFTPHHILEWGAKTALSDAIELYELPSGSRRHILERAREVVLSTAQWRYENHRTIYKASP